MELNLTGRSGHGTPDDFASLSAVIIDGDSVFVDQGAIHGKSRVERGISFTARSSADVPGGRRIAIVWVTLKRGDNGMGFNGMAAAIPFQIDTEAKIGYKSLPDQVNRMGDAMQGKINLEQITDIEKQQLMKFLQEFRGGELWSNAQPGVRAAFDA